MLAARPDDDFYILILFFLSFYFFLSQSSLSQVRFDFHMIEKMKRSFFQAAVVSILLYGCTTWTLRKSMEEKLDGNYTRMLRALLNKS